MLHDVIVVGSGPAGAVAASVLASRGKSVLLVDRQSFPRDKVCGDGLPLSVTRMLHDMGIDIRRAGLEYQQIKSLCLIGPAGQALTTYEDRDDLFSMTSRRFSFDNVLHQHALKSGATFEVMNVQGPLFDADQERVVGVIERNGKTQIEHEAKLVIAADGAGSSLARAMGARIATPDTTAVAIRAYGKLKRRMDPCVYFYFKKSLLPGYGWIFPIANGYANIGVYLDNGTYRRGNLSLEDRLSQFQSELPPEFALEVDPATVKAWPLPLWTGSQRRTAQGMMFAGDAGSFINAITGGGIYTAMVSGQLAAAHGLDLLDSAHNAAPYEPAWQAELAPSLRTAYLIQRYVASSAPLFNTILAIAALRPVRQPLLKALSGEHY